MTMRFFIILAAISFLGMPHATAQSKLDSAQKEEILAASRAYFEGGDLKLAPSVAALPNPVIVTVFSTDGQLLLGKRADGSRFGLDQKLRSAIDAAKEDLAAVNESTAVGGGKITPANTYLHLLVVGHTGRFANFGITGLFDNKVFEPRVTGLAYELDGRREEINPLEMLTRNYTPKQARAILAKRLGIAPTKMPERNDLTIEIYQADHFGERFPDREYTEYLRGHRKLDVSDVDYELLDHRLALIGNWYQNNIIDGEVTRILDLGVELECGVSIGRDISLDDLRAKHAATFVGIGAHKGRLLGVEG